LSSGGVSWVNTAAPPFYEVSGHTGGFTTGLPILVPSFRGLEPSLSLTYNSSGRNGFAGVGWDLSGIDLIERRNKDGGWPRFDSTDTYWWRGQKLVACGTSGSPGCDAGGTHFTESETYARIIDNEDDTWTVTGRNGTQSTYTVMGYTGTKRFRYGLSTVEDVLGNTVPYVWSCASATDPCYPASIEYNGAAITFHRETRPDPITSPGNIVQSERLKTIEVEVSSSPVRAYKLLYDTSPTTSRSLLSNFQLYGTDVVLDGSGTVTGGTSLPATTFTYRGDTQAASFTDGSVWATGACDESLPGTVVGSGDFDGDGLSDLYCHWDAPGNAFDTKIAFAQPNGSFGTPQLAVNDWCHLTYAAMDIGDFNGDGFLDFACQSKVIPRNTYVALNDGDGTFSPPSSWSTTSNWCELSTAGVQWGTAEVNGDGKTDVWCHRGQQWGDEIWVGVSTGTSFSESKWANYCWTVDAFFTFGPDVNGDGNGDAICRGASSGFVEVLLSKGNGFYGTTFPHLQYWCGGNLTFGAGDFNGDGKSDLWCRQPTDTPDRVKGVYVALSTGDAWTGWTTSTDTTAAPNWCATQQIGTGDFNGDGRTDFSCHNLSGSNETWVRLSKDRVAGLTAQATWNSGWCTSYEQVGDFNGDSKTDLLCHSGTTSKVAVSGDLRGRTDLLEELTSSLGGSTSVAYTPSSDWENTNGPPVRETVTSVTVEDGRGWQSTTSYTYADGLFDAAKGRDLGFGYSKVTFPKLATETFAPNAETWFSQTIASAGAVVKTERRDGSGKIFHGMENTIDVDGDGTTEPYRAEVSERWSYVYDGTVTGCASWPCTNGERRYEEYDYDNWGNTVETRSWGNTVETRSWGNYDVSGDETTSIAEFYPNDSTYVTGKTARQASYVGIGTAGTKLTESRFFYDDATQQTMSPVEGLLTKTSVWRNTDDQFVPMCNLASCIEYDP